MFGGYFGQWYGGGLSGTTTTVTPPAWETPLQNPLSYDAVTAAYPVSYTTVYASALSMIMKSLSELSWQEPDEPESGSWDSQ